MLNTFFNAVTKAIAHSASERAAYVKSASERAAHVKRNQPTNTINVKRQGSTAKATERDYFTERETIYSSAFNPNIFDMPGDDMFDLKI